MRTHGVSYICLHTTHILNQIQFTSCQPSLTLLTFYQLLSLLHGFISYFVSSTPLYPSSVLHFPWSCIYQRQICSTSLEKMYSYGITILSKDTAYSHWRILHLQQDKLNLKTDLSKINKQTHYWFSLPIPNVDETIRNQTLSQKKLLLYVHDAHNYIISSILLKWDFSKLYPFPESDRHPILPQLRTTL